MTAKLVAEEGILKGLVLPLEDGDQWVVGRDPDACQLLLEDPAASRKHLLLKKSADGIVLENLSKTNPVEVNNEELVTPRVLQDGDMVKIGSGIFRFDFPPNQVHVNDAAEDLIASDEKSDSIFEDNLDQKEKQQGDVDISFDFLDIGRWLLKVIGGPNNGAEFSMQENTSYIIGTDPNTCDIVFHDTSVSRQHARISISDDELVIEDLRSRNGTLVDGQKIEGKEVLSTNTIVTLGTTSFVIYDREGNMQTIISPLLPSIVKVLQKDEEKGEEESEKKEEVEEVAKQIAPEPIKEPVAPPKEKNLGKFLLTSFLTGLVAITAIGVLTLFRSEPVVVEQQAHPDKILADMFQNMPNIKYSFNKSTGRLFLIGHVLTAQDKNQLLYNLQGLNFIKSTDDSGIIIDEYVWQEANLLLNKNPNWRGITIQSPTAGQFVLSGYLQTRKEAEQLYEYLASNFPYLDRLEKRVIVDEEVLSAVRNDLENVGIRNVTTQFSNGEIILTGGVAKAKEAEFNHIVEELKKIPGVRNVRLLINEIAPEQAMINISDKYEVTGVSVLGSHLSVIINGRIVSKGDVLDGMLIKEVTPGTIFLEKNGVKYRIDFAS